MERKNLQVRSPRVRSKKYVILIFAVIMAVVCVFAIAGCGNVKVIDTTWTFDRAYIAMPDGTVVTGEVTSWKDYEASDMIQVEIDGKTYLTHSCNVVMVAE